MIFKKYLNSYNIFALLIMLVFSGCKSTEYYKDRAANQARNYIFEKVPKMSPQNAAYIKYTYPIFITSPIYMTSYDNGTASSNFSAPSSLSSTSIGDFGQGSYWNGGSSYFLNPVFSKSKQFSQVAIAWNLENPKVTILVIGACFEDFQDWYPVRLIVRGREETEAAINTYATKNTKNN